MTSVRPDQRIGDAQADRPNAVPERSDRFAGTGAAILVECLVRRGIRTIFGLPGDTGVHLYDALYHRSDRIRHVLARDERHAAVMADVYARCTNSVGVVEASSGAGVTYVVGGLGEPYAASIPLLVISTDIRRTSRGTGAVTEVDQVALFAAVTKWAVAADRAADLPDLVDRALAVATSGRPGPVALILPDDVLAEHAESRIAAGRPSLPRERPLPADGRVREAAAQLQAARWPAIVAGSGIHLSAAWDELARLAHQAGIPVATTIHGKGAIPETSSWSLGVVGANGARSYANDYLAAADVVLFVGTRANATDTNGYTTPPRDGAAIIQVDIEPERAGRNYPGSLALVGDAKATLARLVELLEGAPERSERIRRWIAERRQAWLSATTEAGGPGNGAGSDAPPRLAPRAVLQTIRAIVGSDATVIGDPGTPTPNLACFWETTSAGRSVIIPRGHGPMGYAIPGAIGAALARPARPVVAFTTDGSLAMAGGELETAARYGLPIVFVQFTNRSFGWIKMLQHLYLGKRYFGVDHGPIDAVAVARACGMKGLRAERLEELATAVRESVETGRPLYVEVEVPDEIALTPPVAPWQAALAGKAERPVY